MKITSRQNPRYKTLLKLKDKKHREKSKQFLIEGCREISRALQADFVMEDLYVCEELFLGDMEKTVMHSFPESKVFFFPKDMFERLSYRDRPDGLIATAPTKHLTLQDIKLSKNPLVVVCESIEKPGNLGSILRSSDAVGVDCVIVCDKKTDIFNPNVVRASIGTLFSTPVVEATKEEVYQFLLEQKLDIVATTPHTENLFTQTDLGSRTAILMGTEQLGLSDFWLQKATKKVRIPMYGIADSLNVAAATTLVLYEAKRQLGYES